MKIEYKSYQHFSFDLWLTLIKSNPDFKLKRNLLLKDFFEIDFDIKKVNEVVRYYDVLCNNINERTGLNINTFEIYYLILNSLDCKISDVSKAKIERFYAETELLFMSYKPMLIYSKIESVFKEIISEGRTLSILSNTGFIKGSTMRKLISSFGFDKFFSFQIYSDEVGFSKPNFEVFNLTYDKILLIKNIERKDILHVGDNVFADHDGAVHFGFDALLV